MMNITKEFLSKYNKSGPRYTSYPPANIFSSNFSAEDYKALLVKSNGDTPKNISLYIHIPFCINKCYFCGCNSIKFENDEIIKNYIGAILKEIDMLSEKLDSSRVVTQIHFGGGTPNAIDKDFIHKIMFKIKEFFILDENCEIAMECNPAYLDLSYIKFLYDNSFNRISIGVQDFNSDVLKAINREPSQMDVLEIIAELKKYNFKGINIDLMYGLPKQTLSSFEKNLDRAIELNPDRIVTFSYAHIPWVNSDQKKLEAIGLPSTDEKILMLITAINKLTTNGYEFIGMDHFAKSDDDLALALKDKKLHRNFQGYCTKFTTGQVYGLGATSISQLENGYAQNSKEIGLYTDSILKNNFIIEKGYLVSEDEKIIRNIINELMCNCYLDLNEIAETYNKSVEEIKTIISFDVDKLQEFVDDELLTINNNIFVVNSRGRLVVRNIAMVFDPALLNMSDTYSQTV